MLIIARNDLYKINFGYISIGSNESNVLIRRLFLDRELCIIKANTCQYLSARGKICGHVSIERSFFISLCETFLYSIDNLTFLVLAFVDSSIGSGESIWRKFIGCTEFNGRTALIHNEEHTRGRINTWVTKESSVACELIRGGAITRPRCAMGMRVKCVSRTNHSI